MNELHKKIAISVVLSLFVLLSWLRPLDSTAEAQIQEGLKRSVASYVVAKSLNAVISFVQGTEISFQIGVGATLAPGQVLDPVNDLVEQFAELMLFASVAFGVMVFLVKIGSSWIFSIILTACVMAWLFLKWQDMKIPELLTKVLVVVLFVRFSMPLVSLANDFVYSQFLEEEYKVNQAALAQGENDLSAQEEDFQLEGKANLTTPIPAVESPAQPLLTPRPHEASQDAVLSVEEAPVMETTEKHQETSGIWSRLKAGASKAKEKYSNWRKPEPKNEGVSGGLWQQVKATLNFREKIDRLKASADKMYTQIVNLIVVFILQTIVIPLLFFWGLYRLSMGLLRSTRSSEPN